jgi:hypothetical protein
MTSSNAKWSPLEQFLLLLVLLAVVVFGVAILYVVKMRPLVPSSSEIQAIFSDQGSFKYVYIHQSYRPENLFESTEAWCIVTDRPLKASTAHFVLWKNGKQTTTTTYYNSPPIYVGANRNRYDPSVPGSYYAPTSRDLINPYPVMPPIPQTSEFSETEVTRGWDSSVQWNDQNTLTVTDEDGKTEKLIRDKQEAIRYMWDIAGCDMAYAPK